MNTDDIEDFPTLLQRLRDGDEQAATILATRFENEVRRYIRFRLTTPSVRRLVDSLDVYQSVLLNFFIRIEKGELQLDSPAQLQRLLLTMARNKIIDHARRQHSDRRDARRNMDDGLPLEALQDPNASPSQIVAADEIMAAIKLQLSQEDQLLLESKLAGSGWTALAEEFGGTPDALRKRLTRALDRAAEVLGICDPSLP